MQKLTFRFINKIKLSKTEVVLQNIFYSLEEETTFIFLIKETYQI
jgi:hypothetical protein